ncbi:hypothetical protein PMG71_11150 [Roseofilum sp. BLCC_M154]|uniref:Ig-like domain-containing protein n=1 Tax=Roseofilum acuticapitatum BLCC-M154 TaxID=3022444 RepID=A0ABT7AU83_9CYAN|nr:hypothetical protein [Roseofilum acuticapitatum]MDJ1169984.1 hypothetical protein [Roseofilum acuticapitatum BLCC-M154]
MSKHRWFILGILSFFGFVFAQGSWINRLLALILCGLLGADSGLCMATVAKYSGKTVAATPAMVEEILLAQRSREFDDPPVAPPPGNSQPVPAFPQDAGPDYIRPDFGDTQSNPQSIQSSGDLTFVSHTIISSDRRKIVFQSPSTGLEEVYITTSPNSAEFKILEIWLNNIPNISDPRGKNIKIYFDDSYIAKARLADNTMVLIRQDAIIVTLPNGQTENIPISQSQSRNQGDWDKINYISHVKQNIKECVDKYIKQEKKVENNVKLAYAFVLLAVGYTLGGIGAVVLTAIATAFVTWLENAKIDSDYDDYRLNKARRFCQAEADNQNNLGHAPVITSFTCRGNSNSCTVKVGDSNYLTFTYTDRDGDASEWKSSSYSGEISPPNGQGSITFGRCTCDYNRYNNCHPTTVTFRVSVYDKQGNEGQSTPIRVRCEE